MRELPETVRIVSDKGPSGFVTINADTYDPATMKLHVDEPVKVVETETSAPGAPTGSRRPGKG